MWTAHKARFIERYLYYFVQVTHHGTYIDGFAGPQQPDDDDMWTAKRVLESEPRWFRHFYLFDLSPTQVARLQALKQAQRPPDRSKKERRRTIHVEQGDFNSLLDCCVLAGDSHLLSCDDRLLLGKHIGKDIFRPLPKLEALVRIQD